MILLDTHIWVWWVHNDPTLSLNQRQIIRQNEPSGLGVSVISCWEVAKLVEYKRLILPWATSFWMDTALAYPGITLLDLNPAIAIKATQLPGQFHKDPVDQILVATAMYYQSPMLTNDTKILSYPYVISLK